MAKNLFFWGHFFRHPVALLVIVAFPVIVALPVMYGMVSYDILSSWVTNYFYPARARALFRSEMYRMLSWNCMVLPGISLYRLVYLLPLNGITWYCIVLYCVVGFGARAVSRKTPIFFIQPAREPEGRARFAR